MFDQTDTLITKDVIDSYKREWKKHGFPDVDFGARGAGNLNDPTSRPTQEAILWSCVLRQAFMDIELYEVAGYSKRRYQNANDAKAWFATTDANPGDFEWVCDMLGLDADYVRNQKVVRSGQRYTVMARPHGRSRGL